MTENFFAYVSFVNNNETYINLMKTTIKSVLKFSKYRLILYCIDFDGNHVFEPHERLVIRLIVDTILPSIYYYKPFVIIDSILQGLRHGYYIESDDVMTPFCDNVVGVAEQLTNIPVSPIHEEPRLLPVDDMIFLNVPNKTQGYIHGHVVFKHTNLSFLTEWLNECLRDHVYVNADETVLNCMYWRYNCKNHFIGTESSPNDPYYLNYYTNPDIRHLSHVLSFHGCKNPEEQSKLFQDMVEFYK